MLSDILIIAGRTTAMIGAAILMSTLIILGRSDGDSILRKLNVYAYTLAKFFRIKIRDINARIRIERTKLINIHTPGRREYISSEGVTHIFTDRPVYHYCDREWSLSGPRLYPQRLPYIYRGRTSSIRHGWPIFTGAAGYGRIEFLSTWSDSVPSMITICIESIVDIPTYRHVGKSCVYHINTGTDWRMRRNLFHALISDGFNPVRLAYCAGNQYHRRVLEWGSCT